MKTIFGASGPTISSPDVLKYICGENSIFRTQTVITEYRGKGNGTLNKYLDAAHYCYYNVNYESVRKTGQGDKIPNPFPKDLAKYRNGLEPIFQYYKDHKNKDKIIWVCENEPTTKAFHSGPMSDYIAMLRVFVEVGKQYGCKCIDGAVHVDRVNAAKQPSSTSSPSAGSGSEEDPSTSSGEEDYDYEFYEDYDTPTPFMIPGTDTYLTSYSSVEEYRGSSTEVAELLTGYRTIPDLYAVNMHTANIGGDFESEKIGRAVQKVKDWTGHPCVSNEWHVENSNNAELVTKIAKGWADAGIEFSVYLSGAGGSDVDLNNGMNLTQFGTAYRNAIATHKSAT